MNNACPECGAIYAVAEKDVGRRIACKKCNTALLVAEEGLIRDAANAARRDELDEPERGRDDEERPARRRRARSEADDAVAAVRSLGPGAGDVIDKLRGLADVSTWLYGIGLVLAIYSFFAPMLDQASVAVRQGDIDYAKVSDDSDNFETQQRNDGKPTEADNKEREKRIKEYEREKERPRFKRDFAVAYQNRAAWWNVIFRLIGFGLLAFGSIGYLATEQSSLKRLLGGVTILLILLQVIGGAAGLHLQLGGKG